MEQHELYRAAANAGIRVRQHHTDPALGWVATTRWGQRGPYPNAEQALSAAILLLVQRIEQLEAEDGKRREGKALKQLAKVVKGFTSWM